MTIRGSQFGRSLPAFPIGRELLFHFIGGLIYETLMGLDTALLSRKPYFRFIKQKNVRSWTSGLSDPCLHCPPYSEIFRHSQP